MTATQTFDLYLWKKHLPGIKPTLFKSRFFSLAAIFYISIFSLPRKFILHYFNGKGKSIKVDTKKIISENPDVFDLLINQIIESYSSGIKITQIPVSQLLVSNPNYKYSIGSFTIDIDISGNEIEIKLNSFYQYREDNDRISRYIHNRLYSLKEKGKAKDFKIEGSSWISSFEELPKTEINSSIRKYVDFNRLYL